METIIGAIGTVVSIAFLLYFITSSFRKNLDKRFDSVEAHLEGINRELRALNNRLVKQETWSTMHEQLDNTQFTQIRDAVEKSGRELMMEIHRPKKPDHP